MKDEKDLEKEFKEAFDGGAGEAAGPKSASDAAPTGSTEAPAVAVVIADKGPAETDTEAKVQEPTEVEGQTQTPDEGQADEQRLRSWEGRLRKREQELAAREAATASAAPGEGQATEVNQYADGGGVEKQDQATTQDDEQLIKDGLETYGQEFAQFVSALIRKQFKGESEPLVSNFQQSLDELKAGLSALDKSTADGISGIHMGVLEAIVDNLDEILSEEGILTWIDGLPEAEKVEAEKVVASGTIGQIKRLISKYEASKKPAEPSEDDLWAEDAATSVRGSSPVRIPSKVPVGDDDEFSAAFGSA